LGQARNLDLPSLRRYLPKEMSIPSVLPVPDESRADTFRPLRRKSQSAPLPAQPVLHAYYHALFAAHGPQHWWPGRTRFEVIVGAILTQNTSWTNVERAITALRKEKLLTVEAMERVSLRKLARLIRSSGYFRQKARKLKEFVGFLRSQHHGSLSKMFQTPTAVVREQLLAVHGIGPETADSILLYAGNHPVFVVDAYTRRILQRHGLARGKESYEDIRTLFEKSLPANRQLFNEYHALIVHAGKHFCRAKAPLCSSCALRLHLPEIPEGAR
jgi:endonuclease III related protein